MWAVANYCIIHAREVNSLLGQDVGAAQRILPACEQGTRAGGEKEICHLGRNDAVEVGEAKRSEGVHDDILCQKFQRKPLSVFSSAAPLLAASNSRSNSSWRGVRLVGVLTIMRTY
jgi:hypothetical protein